VLQAVEDDNKPKAVKLCKDAILRAELRMDPANKVRYEAAKKILYKPGSYPSYLCACWQDENTMLWYMTDTRVVFRLKKPIAHLPLLDADRQHPENERLAKLFEYVKSNANVVVRLDPDKLSKYRKLAIDVDVSKPFDVGNGILDLGGAFVQTKYLPLIFDILASDNIVMSFYNNRNEINNHVLFECDNGDVLLAQYIVQEE